MNCNCGKEHTSKLATITESMNTAIDQNDFALASLSGSIAIAALTFLPPILVELAIAKAAQTVEEMRVAAQAAKN